jgi:hypothetical protein
VWQRASVVINPYEIAGVDKAAANAAPEIMVSLADAPPVDALAEHRPARHRFIDRHDRSHLAALSKSELRIAPRPDLEDPTLKTRP